MSKKKKKKRTIRWHESAETITLEKFPSFHKKVDKFMRIFHVTLQKYCI